MDYCCCHSYTCTCTCTGAPHTHTHTHTKYTRTHCTHTHTRTPTHTHTHTQDSQCRSALYLLAANLPKSSVSSIATGTLTSLSALSYPVKSQDYSSLLLALTAWGQAGHVIKLTNEWLGPELQGDRAPETASGETHKPKVHVHMYML